MRLVTNTDVTVWIVSALLALGIASTKYAKWKSRNQLVRDESGPGNGSAAGINAAVQYFLSSQRT